MGKLEGKVALISGAVGGFGAELVRVFARKALQGLPATSSTNREKGWSGRFLRREGGRDIVGWS